MKRIELLSVRPRCGPVCAAITAVLGISLLSGAAAHAQPVDNSNPPSVPVAPVPYFAPAVDLTNPNPPPSEGAEPRAASQRVEANINASGTGLDYVALILDSDGVDNLYIKVQRPSGSGDFTEVGFYHGVNAGGWTGITGGASFVSLTSSFDNAHMIVTHDGAGNVTLQFTNINGGAGTQTYTRGGWTPRDGGTAGMGGVNGLMIVNNWGYAIPSASALCDAFNRPDGGLGSNWLTTVGTASIVGNSARLSSGAIPSRSLYVGCCGGGISQTVEADVACNTTGTLDYCAMAFNYDGSHNLYVKVQQQGSPNQFTHIGLYDDVNGGGWVGQTGGGGFFAIPAGQEFSSAHMKATLCPNGTVRLTFSNIDGGSGMLMFQRGGWTFLTGDGAGIGGYNSTHHMDNFAVGGLGVCDRFNRPNSSSLGPNWTTDTGTAGGIDAFAASPGGGATPSRSIFTGICGSCLDNTPPLVNITAPASFTCVCNSVAITGSVSDSNGMYVGDTLEYHADGSNTWIVAASATGARSGTLYTFNTAALTEGYYHVRVRGTNDCDLSQDDNTIIWVGRTFDAAILRSPTSGQFLGGVVCFDGTAEDNNCFLNYSLMYRALPAGVFAPVNPAFGVYTTSVRTDALGSWNTASGPTAVADGNYEVRLRGTDRCGDIADVIRPVTIDNTSPIGTITSPTNCQYVQGTVTVIGTASDANLSSWVLQYDQGGSSPWVTINSGTTNVINGVLGNWNTIGLPVCAYTLRLVVGDQAGVNCSGNDHQAEFHVKLNVGRRCDMNVDGLCNGLDVQVFVNCLLGVGPCP